VLSVGVRACHRRGHGVDGAKMPFTVGPCLTLSLIGRLFTTSDTELSLKPIVGILIRVPRLGSSVETYAPLTASIHPQFYSGYNLFLPSTLPHTTIDARKYGIPSALP
jgi:hypothetical protein